VPERRESMLPSGLGRFVVLGAVGFGAGGAFSALSMLWTIPLPVSVLVGGAAGGASLGVPLGGLKRITTMAVLGAVGLAVGVSITLSIASFVGYSPLALGAMVGAVVGASLGLALLDWKTVLVLGLAGALGFGIGYFVGDLLRASFPIVRGIGSIVVAGVIGGGSLGGALSMLQVRQRN
jgi:hypothetical protein